MGLDLGLKSAGVNIISGQELDKFAVHTAALNGEVVIPGDLRNFVRDRDDVSEYLDRFGMKPGEPFAFVGGPPCQSFSTAGKRAGLEDDRGTLIFDYLSAVKYAHPRFVILENVKGLASMKSSSGASVLEMIHKDLENAGYSVISGVVDAVNFGAPQFRERLIVVASRDNEPIYLPSSTHFQHHQNPAYRWVTLRDAIGDLEGDPGMHASYSPRIQAYVEMVEEGKNWRSLPPGLVEKAMGGAWSSGGGKVGYFRRLRYDEPSPTLVTSPTQKATMLTHPRFDRPLSVREYARIQGFPDNWKFAGSVASIYKQIGNAVPVALGRALGQMLVSLETGGFRIETKRTRGTSAHRQPEGEQTLSFSVSARQRGAA